MHFINLFGRLKYKILVLFISILILPLILLMLLSTKRINDVANTDYNKRLQYASRLFKDSLQNQLDSFKIRVKTVADFDFFSFANNDFDSSEILPFMQYEIVRSGLDYIALVQNRSRTIVSQGALSTSPRNEKIINEICVSPLTVNLYVIDNAPWIFAAAMISKLKTSNPYHVIFAKKISPSFADNLKWLTGAEFSIVYAGKWITTTLMNNYGKRMTGQPAPAADSNSGKMQVHAATHTYVREAAFSGSISDPIRLEISLPDSEYNHLSTLLQRDFIIFGILSLILAVATGTILAINIATPLDKLAKTTSELSSGNYNLPTISSRNDEIGILYENFSEMVSAFLTEQNLKEKKMRELNTLYEISNSINFFNNSEELLKSILQKAVEVLVAERGSIMLLDDTTDELMVKVTTGGRYRIISTKPVKLGKGICGTVALEGKGQICNEGFNSPGFANFGSLMPIEDIKSLICSPLKFKEGTIGVINIVNKLNDEEFNDNDLSLLNLIASQAAVTIENNKLYELSITDGLTKLYVRRYFEARLGEELLRARRYNQPLALIMIDIDNFKAFNDQHGHQIGDIVLQKVAKTVKDTVRIKVDVPCRYGGEEIVIILPETRSSEAIQTAERLRENVSSINIANIEGLGITISLGVAGYPQHSHDALSLVRAADKALYRSKNNGKNCSTIAEEV